MRTQLNITSTQLNQMESGIKSQIDEAAKTIEWAMAEKFQECVLANFGPSGPYRPWSGWHDLSPAYAKKVKRTYATLFVSGALKGNVLIELEGKNFKVVSDNSRVPYATAHQEGNPKGNRGHPGLPAREYFPMTEDGEVTRQVQDIVLDAAYRAAQEALS